MRTKYPGQLTPLLMDDLLIQKEDFSTYKDISENIDTARIDALILQAQIMDLRGFLGRELYLLMLSDYDISNNSFADPIYNNLFFGTDYNNIRYYGLRPMLIQFTYARIISDLNINITRAGVRVFEAEESEAATQAAISTKASAARSEGLVYLEDARLFLEFNAAIYPTWEDKNNTTKTGFKWFKVP